MSLIELSFALEQSSRMIYPTSYIKQFVISGMQEFQNTETFVDILRKINTRDDIYFSNSQTVGMSNINTCLYLLEKNSLIKHEGEAEGYAITQKCIEYLKAHDKFIELLLKK